MYTSPVRCWNFSSCSLVSGASVQAKVEEAAGQPLDAVGRAKDS